MCVTRADKYSSVLGYVLIQVHTIHNKSPGDSILHPGVGSTGPNNALNRFKAPKAGSILALPFSKVSLNVSLSSHVSPQS